MQLTLGTVCLNLGESPSQHSPECRKPSEWPCHLTDSSSIHWFLRGPTPYYYGERTVPAGESSKALSVLAGEVTTGKHTGERPN